MPQACEQRVEESLLHAYVDGEFDAEATADLQAHLVGCPACTQTVRMHQSYKSAMSRASELAPHALALNLREMLDDEVPDNRWAHAFRDPRGVAIAAAFVGAAAWFLAGGLHHPLIGRPVADSLVDDGVALHTRQMPLDYQASDVGSAQQWLSSRLDFGVHLPRFQPQQGPQLQGVRLSNVQSRPAAVVSYMIRADGRRVSLLIVDDPERQLSGSARKVEGREVYLTRSRGYNVVSWRNDEVVYSLVSDLDEQDVLALAQAAEQRQ
jgi:anti-sigma factor RsiW